MTTATFSALPAEIHFNIANYCGNNDLINLCLTSKWMKERCLSVLYRHVDLQLDRDGVEYSISELYQYALDERKRQIRFVHTLLSHPEYGHHVQFLKTPPYIPRFYGSHEEMNFEGDSWRAMQSLTRVQSMVLASSRFYVSFLMVPIKKLPNDLFQSATSVRLGGKMQYGLAKSILNAINPATLKHLYVDAVQDWKVGQAESEFVFGDRDEDGRIVARGAISGLLTTLTGRCTALRTLILRRLGQNHDGHDWHMAAEEALYFEWASFIRSVRGTVERFTFDQIGRCQKDIEFTEENCLSRTMNERFRRHVLPAIVAGDWPFLTIMNLLGVGSLNGQGGAAAVTMELRAALGVNTKIVVKEQSHYGQDC